MKGKRDGKLAPRARLCCFLGYSNTQKAYKLWDPIERTVVISRDVTFDETVSPSRLERPATPLSDLKSKLHFDRADKLPSPLNDSIPSTDADVFETVGDVPHAVEAVGAEDPVGAQEAERHETGEEIDRGQQDQPQYRGWEYELDHDTHDPLPLHPSLNLKTREYLREQDTLSLDRVDNGD